MLKRVGITAVALSFCSAVLPSCNLLTPRSPVPDDVVFQSQYLTAILKLPGQYDSSKTYPLLVALHGNGGTSASFAPLFSSIARASVLVAVPQGEYRKPVGGYSWFYETSDRSLWEEYDTRSVAGVVALISDLRARYPIGKVFVLGFSQGASLAYMTGLRNPSLVAGILAISGYLPEIDREWSVVHAQDVINARNVEIFVARGTSDSLVNRQAFTAQRDFLVTNGYSVTEFEFAGAHYLTEDLLFRVLQWVKERPGG